MNRWSRTRSAAGSPTIPGRRGPSTPAEWREAARAAVADGHAATPPGAEEPTDWSRQPGCQRSWNENDAPRKRASGEHRVTPELAAYWPRSVDHASTQAS